MNKALFGFAACVMSAYVSVAGSIEDSARKIAKDYGNAVVHVSAVNKITVSGPLAAMMGGGQEQKVEATATIIDPSGLAMIAESAINPTALMSGMEVNMGGKRQKLDMKAELTEVKYRLADGTEFPGRIILKDEDLDIAFVAPEKPLDDETKAKFTVVPLKAGAPVPNVLDEIILVGRLGKNLQYASSVNISRIIAMLKKPRPFYVAGSSSSTPVFNADGVLIGLSAARRSGVQSSARRPQATPVIVPAEDIADLAIQAKEEAAK